ncbi:hypothetical protein RK305_10815, partial [Streptococcus pneumoniae]|nr:hypothetical protein [Streptococcus pneumoniae]
MQNIRKDLVFLLNAESFFTFVKKDSKCTDPQKLEPLFVRIEKIFVNFTPQLFTPNLKTIQNPCLSLDPGWFLFSPNGCFLLDKKEFPLYGISVEKNT